MWCGYRCPLRRHWSFQGFGGASSRSNPHLQVLADLRRGGNIHTVVWRIFNWRIIHPPGQNLHVEDFARLLPEDLTVFHEHRLVVGNTHDVAKFKLLREWIDEGLTVRALPEVGKLVAHKCLLVGTPCHPSASLPVAPQVATTVISVMRSLDNYFSFPLFSSLSNWSFW